MQTMDIDTAPGQVRVRRAERPDLPCLMRMIAELAAFNGDIATATPQAMERDLFGATACAQALLATRAGEAAGYAVICSRLQLHFGERVMELHHLYVAAEHRGAGIGRHLVAAAVGEARRQGCRRLEVGTHPENLRAQAIYGSLGFAPLAERGPRFGLDLPAAGALPAGWI